MNSMTLVLFFLSTFPSTQTGRWEGQARPVNDFLQHLRLPVVLSVDSQGQVEGSLGNATLRKAQLRPRRKSEWKAMNHYDYRIDFQLEGDLVAGVSRNGGRLLLTWHEDHWEGWVMTEGSLFGGKSRVQIQAVDLVLKRPEAIR